MYCHELYETEHSFRSHIEALINGDRPWVLDEVRRRKQQEATQTNRKLQASSSSLLSLLPRYVQ